MFTHCRLGEDTLSGGQHDQANRMSAPDDEHDICMLGSTKLLKRNDFLQALESQSVLNSVFIFSDIKTAILQVKVRTLSLSFLIHFPFSRFFFSEQAQYSNHLGWRGFRNGRCGPDSRPVVVLGAADKFHGAWRLQIPQRENHEIFSLLPSMLCNRGGGRVCKVGY